MPTALPLTPKKKNHPASGGRPCAVSYFNVKMLFSPVDLGQDRSAAADRQIIEANEDGAAQKWCPMFQHGDCTFNTTIFETVMSNLIKNPNINSSWLFRADILLDSTGPEVPAVPEFEDQPPLPRFNFFGITRTMVRKMIPRNELRDDPLEQTCMFYSSASGQVQKSLIIYLPHVKSESDVPFYHPTVRGIAFLHEWNLNESKGTISIHYCFFDESAISEKLTRTALNLLRVLHKHGEGQAAGYIKKVNHDVLVPQIALQNRYASLKQRHARALVKGWLEVTDPEKHVFEDLCIAAFLIELWHSMYKATEFPGFVDIGCGNGLLVHILNLEGYTGWGFDARERKSWPQYSTTVSVRRTTSGLLNEQQSLLPLVLLPSVVTNGESEQLSQDSIHDGRFPKGTFIISNHADELTPWTPILARVSECPFMMIPCCSHNLTGARFRAPPPKNKTASKSTYHSLVGWVSQIAIDCGWQVETEMLRIPSTRNTALIGRHSPGDSSQVDIDAMIDKYGGTDGYYENVLKLLKSSTRGH